MFRSSLYAGIPMLTSIEGGKADHPVNSARECHEDRIVDRHLMFDRESIGVFEELFVWPYQLNGCCRNQFQEKIDVVR